MDTLEIGKQHHEEVEQLFNRARESEAQIREAPVSPIEGREAAQDILLVNDQDKQVKKLLSEMTDLISSLKVLKETIEHHAEQIVPANERTNGPMPPWGI